MSKSRTRSASASTWDGGKAGLTVLSNEMPPQSAMSMSAKGYLNRFLQHHIRPPAMTPSPDYS